MSQGDDEPRFVDKREGRLDRSRFKPMAEANLPKLGIPSGTIGKGPAIKGQADQVEKGGAK